MQKTCNNHAYIDGQNLYLGILKLGWKLDYRKFRRYLAEKYSISHAYIFLGHVARNERLYDDLRTAGFSTMFKPTVTDRNGNIKGNVDADLVLRAALDIERYGKAVIVTSDGDFYSLTQHLYEVGKLEAVLSPDQDHCASLLRRAAKDRIRYMNNLRTKLEYRNENTAGGRNLRRCSRRDNKPIV